MAISRAQFIRELSELLSEAGIDTRCGVDFPAHMRKRNEKDPRAFAEVDPVGQIFYFAPQALKLSKSHRRGLMMHEIGHVLMAYKPTHSEADADRAAERAFGVKIKYDRKNFPGKGLQCVGRRANPRSVDVIRDELRQTEDTYFRLAAKGAARSRLKDYEARILLLDDELKAAGGRRNPVRGYRSGWDKRRTPKNIYKLCYRTKSDMLKVFIAHNQRMIDELDLEGRIGIEAFDSIRRVFNGRKIDTLEKALWVSVPPHSGPPWCLEDVDVDLLNTIEPVRFHHQGFRLPDHVEEARLAEQERVYYEEMYGGVY